MLVSVMTNNKATKALRSAIQDILVGRAAQDAIGDLLRTWRLENEKTQGEVAEALGVSVPFICDVELGRRGLGDETVAKLEKVVR